MAPCGHCRYHKRPDCIPQCPFSVAFPATNNDSLQNYQLIVRRYQPRFLASRLRDIPNQEQKLVFVQSLIEECQLWEANDLVGSIRPIDLLQSQIGFFRAAIDGVRNDVTKQEDIIDKQLNDLHTLRKTMLTVQNRHEAERKRLDKLLARPTGEINTVITDGINLSIERRDQTNQQVQELITAQTLHIQTEAGNRNLQANGNPPEA